MVAVRRAGKPYVWPDRRPTGAIMEPVLAELLPPEAGVAEVFGDSGPAGLLPEEEAIVAGASSRRRREFATGRYCAHQALAKLGVTGKPVLTGANREPLWPAGIVGSITHCPGYWAAAVARDDEYASIGIDAEPNLPLPARVLEVIALPQEVARLPALAAAGPRVCWDRLLFCAKESVFKAWFPVTGRWLGFSDADVVIERAGATFTATLLALGPQPGDGVPGTLAGRLAVSRGLLLTAVTVPPGARPSSARHRFVPPLADHDR